ncbi:hypothetical protein HZH66_011800 [Vespula vulgaris]|uniref:Uncharacterized protein n=1 Tax=Vespula vulgaris TaxID=7454 RepID=A0A834JD24_VESVU|nr:hypothetical protein HZH66_011800 [Vespula vulgaris]
MRATQAAAVRLLAEGEKGGGREGGDKGGEEKEEEDEVEEVNGMQRDVLDRLGVSKERRIFTKHDLQLSPCFDSQEEEQTQRR